MEQVGAAWRDMSDADLLRRSLRDPEAFGEFYDRHARAILAFLYRRTASADMAADIAAETFAKAFLSRGRYREDSSASARSWLIAIAQHTLANALRSNRAGDRARRRLGMERLSVDDLSLERIEELADFAPLRDAIKDAVASLSPQLANALVLRVGQELPYSEVASQLGCSEGAARVRVARGLKRVADLIGAET
jgi:RNA polymerase sigma factor (sigma-70 family)